MVNSMAMGVMEIATITRTQDYTPLKQNEDNKGMLQQTHSVHQVQKQADQRTKEVNSGENAGWYNKKFDAKEKGGNEYNGDGGKGRKQEEKREQVVMKNEHRGFDIKI